MFPWHRGLFSSLFILQCILDIATGLRHWGWGRYRQRGRYLCNARAQSSIGVKVAITSAAAISKVSISNGHCMYSRKWAFLGIWWHCSRVFHQMRFRRTGDLMGIWNACNCVGQKQPENLPAYYITQLSLHSWKPALPISPHHTYLKAQATSNKTMHHFWHIGLVLTVAYYGSNWNYASK